MGFEQFLFQVTMQDEGDSPQRARRAQRGKEVVFKAVTDTPARPRSAELVEGRAGRNAAQGELSALKGPSSFGDIVICW